jgi:hypothetical protein
VSAFDYRLHADLNVLEVRPVGVVRLNDILAYANEALSRGEITQGTVEYYDLSGMTNLDLDYQSACELTETLQQWCSRGWEGSVFFTPERYQFGMIRMIGAVLESLEGAPEQMMIPHDEPLGLDEVRDFITKQRRQA